MRRTAKFVSIVRETSDARVACLLIGVVYGIFTITVFIFPTVSLDYFTVDNAVLHQRKQRLNTFM